jgi:hypothetical protein
VGPLEKAQTGVGRRKREGPMWASLEERRGRSRERALCNVGRDNGYSSARRVRNHG